MSSAGYTFFKWAAVRRSDVKRLRELETEGQERMAGTLALDYQGGAEPRSENAVRDTTRTRRARIALG